MAIDFAWHLRDTVPIEREVSDTVLLDDIEALLERQWKPVTERGEDFIAFDDPLWGAMLKPNWLAMTIYDRGRIWIETRPGGRVIRYRLRSLHGFIFCLFAAAAFFVFGAQAEGLVGGAKLALIGFA